MNIQSIDVNKILIIIFVGACAVISTYMGIESIPELCLGGLIGYLSKDYTKQIIPSDEGVSDDSTRQDNNKTGEDEFA